MADKSTTVEPEFRFFHAPILSFYARALYRDGATRWKGSGLLYLFFLCAVLAVPEAARTHVQLSRALDSTVLKQAADMVPLVVKEGMLTVDREQPFDLFSDPENGHPVVIVDTTGSLTSLEGSTASALLMKDRVLLKNADGKVTTQLWKDVGEFTVDGPTVTSLMTTVRRFLVLLYYPVATLFMFCWTTLVVMLLAIAARMMVVRAGSQLAPQVIHRVTALALTPALVTTSLLGALDVEIPAAFLLRALMTMGYLTFALSSVLDPHAGEDDGSDDD